MAGWSLWVVGGWVVTALQGVGGYITSSRNAWALLKGNCAGNMILIGEGSGNYYGARLNFRDTSATSCKGLVHGGCWPHAEEQGSNHDLEGKGGYGEMATSGHLTSDSLACRVSFFARLFCTRTRPAIAMDKAHASCGGHVSKMQARPISSCLFPLLLESCFQRSFH
jgi:hypothetical protein